MWRGREEEYEGECEGGSTTGGGHGWALPSPALGRHCRSLDLVLLVPSLLLVAVAVAIERHRALIKDNVGFPSKCFWSHQGLVSGFIFHGCCHIFLAVRLIFSGTGESSTRTHNW